MYLTVGKLIKILKKIDQEADVYIHDHEYSSETEVDTVVYGKYEDEDGYYIIFDKDPEDDEVVLYTELKELLDRVKK